MNYKIKKKLNIYIILLLLNISAFAQITIDESKIQNPLNKLEASFYPNFAKPMKSFIYIINKDTISKSYFDVNGNEHTKLDYEKNKPFYKSKNKYIGNLKSETSFFINNILQSTSYFKYDQNKNLIDWKENKSVFNKITSTNKLVNERNWIIRFDKFNKVKTKFMLNAEKVVIQSYEYTYNQAGDLIEINQLQWKDLFEYKNNLVTKKNTIFKNDNSLYSFIEYKYNSDNLLEESSDKINTNQYEYDLQKLKKINCKNKRDNTFQEIYFFYKNSLLSKVEINTTDLYMKPQFIFLSDYLGFSWKKDEINKLKLEFTYDKFNNVTEIKYFVKDNYKYSKFFKYEYY